MRRAFALTLLSAALSVAAPETRAQVDQNKSIIERIEIHPKYRQWQEEGLARVKKVEEEREAKHREWLKLSPEQRVEFECKELEEEREGPLSAKCRSYYFSRSYKDIWSGDWDINFIVMEGPDGAAFCVADHGSGRIHNHTRCTPLYRVK